MIRRKDPFKDMHEKMSKMFENMTEAGFNMYNVQLPVDIRETDEKIIAEADMPGVDKDNIQVKVKDRSLHIAAQGDREVREEGKNYVRHERSAKSYSRTIQLPEPVKSSSAKAKYKNGVLTVEMEKKEKSSDFNVEIE